MDDREILRLNRLYSRGEITLAELSDAFQENGVTLERFARVLRDDLIRFTLCCLEFASAAIVLIDWAVRMYKG